MSLNDKAKQRFLTKEERDQADLEGLKWGLVSDFNRLRDTIGTQAAKAWVLDEIIDPVKK